MADPFPRLQRNDDARSTRMVARRLLGCTLCHRVDGAVLRGRIVEVEVYTDDAASHAANRKHTPRNRIMFGPAGFACVYFTYGMHHCVNVVAECDGTPGAVLIRGLDGIPHATGPALACKSVLEVAPGPGYLRRAQDPAHDDTACSSGAP